MNLSLWKLIPKTALIKNGLYRGSFAFLPYQKLPLTRIFCLSAWLKTAFIENFSLYRFIENCLYRGFLLYSFIKNGLYWGFFALSKTAFIKDFSLYHFIENGLYGPLLKMTFFALSLYRKRPLSVLIKTAFFTLLPYHFIKNSIGLFL